jgi:hypothetical protein
MDVSEEVSETACNAISFNDDIPLKDTNRSLRRHTTSDKVRGEQRLLARQLLRRVILHHNPDAIAMTMIIIISYRILSLLMPLLT